MQTVKILLEKLKNSLLLIGLVLGGLFAGSIVGKYQQKNKQNREGAKLKAQDEKEKSYEKIKNTSASDIIATADNAIDLGRDIADIQSNFRNRIRDRLKQ